MLHQMVRAAAAHESILGLLEVAHYVAAMKNENASSQIAVTTYMASGSITHAIAAATLAQGALHAPISQARALLDAPDPVLTACAIADRGERVPGYGNSFYKGCIDPAFEPAFNALPEDTRIRLFKIIQNAKPEEHDLAPNAAIITAAVMKHCGVPAGMEPAVFTFCRIPAWVRLCVQAKVPKVGTP